MYKIKMFYIVSWIVNAIVLVLFSGCTLNQTPKNSLNNEDKLLAEHKQVMPSVPPILCKVRMNSWCILNLGMKIEKLEEESQRIWSLTDVYFDDGPIVIFESKMCDAVDDYRNPKKLYEREELDGQGKKHLVFKYQLGGEKICTLEFQLPILGNELKPLYRSSLLSSIKLCNQENCNVSLNDLEPKQMTN